MKKEEEDIKITWDEFIHQFHFNKKNLKKVKLIDYLCDVIDFLNFQRKINQKRKIIFYYQLILNVDIFIFAKVKNRKG